MGRAFKKVRKGLAASWRWLWSGDGVHAPWFRRALALIFFLLLPAPALLLLIFRFAPIPGTPQMLLEALALQPVRHSWRAYEDIAPALPRAVIGAEDQNFCSHNGFDWKGIEKAMQDHKRHPRKPLRGASTISQQTARTLFLVSARSWIRKGVEAYLTVLIEALWPKKRILTAYLNLVDWGHGNYGAQAASEAYFGVDAARLTPSQAARLAAILPNPDHWRADRPGRYVAGRSRHLRGQEYVVADSGLDWCVK